MNAKSLLAERKRAEGTRMHYKEVAVECTISPGGFSGERVVRVKRTDGSEQIGLAPRAYCWTEQGRPLKLDEPAEGKAIKGLVAARRIQDREGGVVIVETPDGEVFPALNTVIRPRPQSEASADVPVRSRS